MKYGIPEHIFFTAILHVVKGRNLDNFKIELDDGKVSVTNNNPVCTINSIDPVCFTNSVIPAIISPIPYIPIVLININKIELMLNIILTLKPILQLTLIHLQLLSARKFQLLSYQKVKNEGDILNSFFYKKFLLIVLHLL